MELWKTRRREILAGGIVLLAIAAVCYFLPVRRRISLSCASPRCSLRIPPMRG